MRALLFVAILTSGITDAMEAVEKAVATALDLTGALLSLFSRTRLPSCQSGSPGGLWIAFSGCIITKSREVEDNALMRGLMSCRR